MTKRSRLVVGVLWALSLVAVWHWSASAQIDGAPGVEVRFVKAQGRGGASSGILLGNFGGQWLPVTLDAMPDLNQRMPRQ